MGRPLTASATYVQITVKLPPDLLGVLRARATESGAPLQTEVIRALKRGLETTQKRSVKHGA